MGEEGDSISGSIGKVERASHGVFFGAFITSEQFEQEEQCNVFRSSAQGGVKQRTCFCFLFASSPFSRSLSPESLSCLQNISKPFLLILFSAAEVESASCPLN